MVCAISSASTGRPSIATIRSPAWSPIACAGDCCPAWSSGATVAILCVACPATVMKRNVKRTIVSRMFAAGPAPIATSRFQVGAFQYASEPSASRSSVIPFSADERAAGDTVCAASASSKSSTALLCAVEVAPLERPLDPIQRAAERRRVLDRVREPPLRVVRNRPVHAGDGHEAAQRDRPQPVLDPVACSLGDRGREADVEPPGAQADRERREEVAALVDDDEEGQPEDCDQEAQAGANLRSARLRASSSARTSSARSPAGAPSTASSASSTRPRDLDEADAAGEERMDGDLVGGVEGARVRAAPLTGFACEPEEREPIEIGRLELERQSRREVESWHLGRATLRVGKGVRDRHTHVRVSEMRDRGAVAEPHERMDDRGRVHDDLDPVVVEPEEVMRLDELETLVRQRRGVDGDLRAHGPRRMREGLLHAH